MDDKNSCKDCSQSIFWWAKLVVAVLVVPAIGAVVALLSGAKGIFGLSVFIVACWVCTYLGMRLMQASQKK